MSCDLSGSSARKTTPKLMPIAVSMWDLSTHGVEGLAHRGCGSPAGLAPVCRHDDWGLLPFVYKADLSHTDDVRQMFGAPYRLLRMSLCGKQHRQNCGVRMADRIDSDAAHHRRDGAVRLGLHPRGAVFEAEMRQPGRRVVGEMPRRNGRFTDHRPFGEHQPDGPGLGFVGQILTDTENRCGGEQSG